MKSCGVDILGMKNVIIIPTYNERENVSRVVGDIFNILPEVYILIVDDSSPDKTYEKVAELQKKYDHLSLLQRKKKEGLGRAYIDAFKHVLKDEEVENVIMMDADYSHDPKYLPQLLDAAKEFDVVMGSRYTVGGRTEGWILWRRLLSKFGNIYARVITKMPIFDCTGGFNLIKTDILKKIDLSQIDVSGYAFLIELKYLLWRAGAQFKEIPIILKNRTHGESKLCGHIVHEGIVAPWKIRSKGNNPKCGCCESGNVKFFVRKNSCDLFKCKDCGLIFVWPLPQNFKGIYSADYFKGATDGYGYADYEKDKMDTSSIFEIYLDKIESVALERGNLLDVGAATGVFMSAAERRGWKTSGVELSSFAAERAREKGLDVISGTTADLTEKNNFFDVVTYLDVFEHITNPKKEVEIICGLLKRGGLLVINTPDSNSLFGRICGRYWHLLIPPEHLYIFSNQNLKKLLVDNGFEIILSDKIGKWFTLRYVVQILANWQKIFIWKWLAGILKKRAIGQLAVPINLKDNMFIIAKKIRPVIQPRKFCSAEQKETAG